MKIDKSEKGRAEARKVRVNGIMNDEEKTGRAEARKSRRAEKTIYEICVITIPWIKNLS
jgi:hypothetical protein